jgi:hypothetical protein
MAAVMPHMATRCLLAVLNDDEDAATEIATNMTADEQEDFIARLRQTIVVVKSSDPED